MVESGEPSPALEAKPSIFGLEWLWHGYWELSTCRQSGMDMGQIPWTAKIAYMNYHGYNEYEQQLLNRTISVLDEIIRDRTGNK